MTNPGAHTDILMSIKPEHISTIATGQKNHEYRKYKLPPSVCRVWFYTTAPVSSIERIARVSGAKEPGEVREDGGIGNADFNAGKKVSMFGYEILQLWKLSEPNTLAAAKERGYLEGPPQKYCWAKEALVLDNALKDQLLVLSKVDSG